jgi:quercetin dioxygenase-like cupin family protein
MLKTFASLLFILTCAAAAMAQDPVKVDSNHYKVEFENAQVRVLRVKVGPGEKSIMHRHPNAVAIFMTDVNGKFTFADGKTEDTTRKAGEVMWTPAITHLPENLGTEAFEVVLVELKMRPPVTRATAPATRALPTNNH